MKKNRIIIVLSLLFLLILFVAFYFITHIGVDLDKGTLLMYSSVKLSEQDVKRINNRELLDDTDYFNDIWEIRDADDGNYGCLFELDFHLDLRRLAKINDYIIEMTIDYSELNDSEKIFFSESSGGVHNQMIFRSNGDEYVASAFISLMGLTYGKSQSEILDIAKKIEIILWIQNENGKVQEKKIRTDKLEIEIQNPNENDIESSKFLLNITE